MIRIPRDDPGEAAGAERNRALRRVDWRFLLARPRPSRSLCLCEGELADAVALISGTVHRGHGEEAGGYDLVAAVDPDAATLRTAYDALAPGGFVYVEWYSRHGTGAVHARRRLEAVGYTDVQLYVPQPGLRWTPPEQWVPLLASGSMSYGLQAQPLARRRSVRWRRAARQALWRLSPRLRYASPLCAVARRPTRVDPGAMSPTQPSRAGAAADGALDGRGSLAAKLRDGWSGWGLGKAPARVSLLLLTGGKRAVNKVVALAFADAQRAPRMAVKLARVPEAAAGLEHEATALRALQERAAELRGVPEVVFFEQVDDLPVLGQTVVQGRRLLSLLSPTTVASVARTATDWQLQLAGTPPLWSPGSLRAQLVEPVIADFAESFGSAVDAGMMREALDVASELGPLPQVVEHRDFSPWNLLVTPEKSLAVLDWESSELHGVPALDLVYLFTYMSVYLSGGFESGRYAACYRQMLDPSTPIGEAAHECLATYVRRLEIEPRSLRALRLLTWMLHARSGYRHLLADGGGRAPAAEQLRGSPFIQLWEAELRYGGVAD